MAKNCITEQAAQRQRDIEQGLLALMHTKQYEEITVSELCKELKMPRRTFYRYFNDKKDVLDSLILHTLQEYSATNVGINIDEMERYFAFWMEKRSLLDALQRSGLSSTILDCALHLDQIEKNNDLLAFQSDLDGMRDAIFLFANSGMTALVIAWHHSGFPTTPTQMARIASRVLTQPLFKYAKEMPGS